MSEFTQSPMLPQRPERTVGSVLSHAFETYKGVFLYAAVALIITSIASYIIQPLTGFDSQEMLEGIRDEGEDFELWAVEGMPAFYGLSGLASLLLSPIYVGLIYISNKYNRGQKIDFGDLFIGYRQNTLNIILYSLIAGILMVIGFSACILPGFVVMAFTFLGYPILLFENANAIEALKKSFNTVKGDFGTFLGISLLAMIISLVGVLLCGIGILLTGGFMLIAMYSAYTAWHGMPRALHEPGITQP